MTDEALHEVSYYGVPEHADEFIEAIRQAGGEVIGVRDHRPSRYWASVQFLASELCLQRVRHAFRDEGNIDVW